MANIVWRRATNKVYVYYYDKALGKLVQVPRSVSQKWDGLPKAEVRALVDQWEHDNGRGVDRAKRILLGEKDKLKTLWDAYQKNRSKLKKRRDRTALSERRVFEIYIVPFFVGEHQTKDPTRWHNLVPEFHTWLFAKDLADDSQSKVLWALERFGAFLVFQRHMPFPFAIQTPTINKDKTTPLKTRISLQDALALAKAPIPPGPVNYRLVFLLAYFGSLRPQEVYALNKEDFVTGPAAATSAKTHRGFAGFGIGSKLSIPVTKTHNGAAPEDLTKSHYSRGVVNVWNSEAAKAIAAIVKTMPDGRLFPLSRGYLDRLWRENAQATYGGTLHDMRRASGLYLGRTARIDLTLLQEHMRHAEIETTLLYCREPSVPDAETVADQDFDDVG